MAAKALVKPGNAVNACPEKEEGPAVSGISKKNMGMLRFLANRTRTKLLVDSVSNAVDKTSTIVAVRMRPLNSREIELDSRSAFDDVEAPRINSTNSITIGKKGFSFDACIGPTISQNDVYKLTARKIFKKVLDGFNGTCMAYGQTDSEFYRLLRGTRGKHNDLYE